MTLHDIIQTCDLALLTDPKDFKQVVPTGGYASDLLSCVMAGAKHKNIWITLQSHINIVAIAALLELSAVIITEGATPDPSVIERANQEGITLFLTQKTNYEIAGQLWSLGLRR